MILALDIGTSSARAGMYDESGAAVPGRFHQILCEPAITDDGGVVHDAAALFTAVTSCIDAVLAGPGLPDVGAVGVATFWHGLLGFDAAGHPVTPIYTWADTRSARDAALRASALDEDGLHARTGCHVHTSYWPAKLSWLAREHPAEMQRVARWGSFGEHLELALFGEAATSFSMASGTGLLDHARLAWDPQALAAAGVEERQLFPLVDRTAGRRGLRPTWARRWPALRGAPCFPAVGDGAASNVGSGCVDPSRVALNIGTSAALRVVTRAPGAPPRGLWRYRVDRDLSLVGGALSEGGNLVAWCRDVLRLPAESIDAVLASVPADGHGLTLLPFIAGERAPGWRGDRRAAVTGLRLATTAADLLRAALEAVALRLCLVYGLLAPWGTPDHAIVASGGAIAQSPAWAQIIADALGRPVTLVPDEQATSRGAAVLALSALGVRPDLGAGPPPSGRTYRPDPARHAHYRDALLRQQAFDARLA